MKIAERFNDFPPYTPIEPFEVLAEKLERKAENIIKLDANENPFGPADRVKEVLGSLDFINIYPDPESRTLRRSLQDFTGLDQSNLMAGAGADELIDLVLRVMLEDGDVVINCPPTFGMYAFDTRLNSGKLIEINRNEDFSLDIEAVIDVTRREKAKILFLTSPNNPDGSVIEDKTLDRLLELPVLVILDEAYIEFTGNTPAEWTRNSRIRLVKEKENLIVLRTFSKWAGLAGLRVGYGGFPDWLMPYLWRAKQPYNVNIAANTAALTSLECLVFLAENVAKIRQLRNELFQNLLQLPFLKPYPSQANFILCQVLDRSAKELKQVLMDKGILVRYYETPLLKNYIRISVGRAEQNKVIIQTLEELK